jgi:hypothetical protein
MKKAVLLTLVVAVIGTDAFAPKPGEAFRSPTTTATTTTATSRSFVLPPLQSFFGDFFAKASSTLPKKELPPVFEPAVIDPDFRVAGIFLTAGILLDFVPYLQLTVGPLVTALGVLFLVQTFRIRFVFDETAFELKSALKGEELQGTGENLVVGGANRWETATIINYDFFPLGWLEKGWPPILVYFKETATPADKWNEGPGKLANDPDKIASGAAVAGQVHFFPAVCNAAQIRDEFAKRQCRKI